MSEEKKLEITKFYKLPGVRDIQPMKARGHFAKALAIEDRAGECTPEAEEQLDLAVAALAE